jgi:hypothetical protein
LITAIGSMEQGLGLSFWGNIVTALPFLLSWTAAGLAFGAFSHRSFNRYGRAAAITAWSWAIALPAGLLLRKLMYGKPIFTIFGMLALFFVYMFILVWRWIVVWSVKRSSPQA